MNLVRYAAIFRPVWWAPTGLLQSAAGTVGAGAAPPALRLERWPTPDGDFVRVHRGQVVAGAPTVLVLHGLEGSVASPYVGEWARLACAQGWGIAALEFRSCGGEPNRLLRSYHSGETGDLDCVVGRLAAEGAGPLCIVGYSLGGNVLLKWLGERGERAPAVLRAAAAVSAPFDLARCAERCDTRYGGAIARRFLRTLIPKAIEKARRFPGAYDPAAVARCRTFRAFDDLVTAPVHGFRDAAHYWATQSCASFLPAIAVPTLLLNAADDPLVPAAAWPHAAVAGSPWLEAEFLPRGGHVAFLDGGWPWRPRRWAERRVLAHFARRE